MALYKWLLISSSLVIINIYCFVQARVYPNFKIRGGGYTKITEFPHSVYLEITSNDGWICGSSLITQRHLLTAAHCVEECTDNFEIFAYAGSAVLTQAEQIRKAKRYVMHHEYNTKTCKNDIALIYLMRSFSLGPTVKRVILVRSFSVGEKGYVAGWGSIDEQDDDPESLKFVEQYVDDCNKIVSNPSQGMICGKSRQSTSFPDRGDSGSAFVTNIYNQIGLVSFRDQRYMGWVVYTNVSYYYNWIQVKAMNMACYQARRG